MSIRPIRLMGGLALALPLALLPLGTPALAQGIATQADAPGTLSVSGRGEARAAPDLAIMRLGVRSEGEDAGSTLRANSAAQAAVIDALKEAGIEARDIQTAELSLDQRMAYPDNAAPRITGYTASNMVAVQLRDLDRLGEILDMAIGAGATNLADLQFTRQDDAELRDQARKAAVEDALHRAQLYAEAAGVSLGEIRSISEVTLASPGPRPMAMMARRESDSVPVEAGELGLSAEIRMEFTLTQ